MKTLSLPGEIRTTIQAQQAQGKIVGFVPTMGSLHAGHVSLIQRAREECDYVVVSIFVNPTQFGPNEDFEKYPRDFGLDEEKCEQANVDLVFHPSVEDIYPHGETSVDSRYPELTKKLCGEFRPGHFDGVVSVMSILLGIVRPQNCYMGRKDAQQLIIVEKLIQESFRDTHLVGCSTMREDDGLAMSSRNIYLTKQQREQALHIYEVLNSIADFGFSDIASSLNKGRHTLKNSGLELQYCEFVNRDNLEHVEKITPGKFLLCIAVLCGTTRLIDNFFVDVDSNLSMSIDRGVNCVK